MAVWRQIFWPTLAMLAALALLLSLGTWQMQRKGEKEALIAAVSARAHAVAPLPPYTAWPQQDPASIDFQRVILNGSFRDGPEFHLYTFLSETKGTYGGPGWAVYLPFDLTGGGTVLVNRGFVPDVMKAASARPASAAPAQGEVAIEGIVRRPERRGYFAATDTPAKNSWITRDPVAMAAAGSLAGVAPFTIEQLTPNAGGLPQTGEVRLTFPNRHLEYALTWYGLMLPLVGVFVVFIRRRLRDTALAGGGREG